MSDGGGHDLHGRNLPSTIWHTSYRPGSLARNFAYSPSAGYFDARGFDPTGSSIARASAIAGGISGAASVGESSTPNVHASVSNFQRNGPFANPRGRGRSVVKWRMWASH